MEPRVQSNEPLFTAAVESGVEAGEVQESNPFLKGMETGLPITPPFAAAAADLLSTTQADLPENIYGASMMAAVRSTQGCHPFFHGVTLSVYIGLFFNFLMQVYILMFAQKYICGPSVLVVRGLYQRFHDEAFDMTDSGLVFSEEKWADFAETEHSDALCQLPLSQPQFAIAILVIWTCTCWTDLQDTWMWTKVWCQLPLSSDGHSHVAVDDDRLVTVSVSMKTRVAIIFFVLLPKFLAACYLWWLGARWLISTTSFGDVLLNSCGLAFLTEADELLYEVLIPPSIKDMVSIYKFTTMRQDWVYLEKSLQDAQDEKTKNGKDAPAPVSSISWKLPISGMQLKVALRMISTMGIMIGVPMCYFYNFQQVLPGYRWDVHGACEVKMQAMLGLH